MKIAMVFPKRESERAISGYSSTLTENMRKQGMDVTDFYYGAGKPMSLFGRLEELSNYDLIHVQHEYNLLGRYGLPFFWVYFYLGLFKKGKIVTTMHTVPSLKQKYKEKKLKTILRKLLYFFQNRMISTYSDLIVVHADFFKEILANDYGFEKNKIKIFPQGILEDVKITSNSKAKKKLRLSGNVYLFMGSMIPDHGHDTIIKQAKKIGKTILVVANPGSVNDRNSERIREYIEYNKKIVRNNNFEKFVRFDIFDITDKNPLWWEYFSAADLVMLPYRGGIGSGVMAHSIAAEKPVVVSNIKYFNDMYKVFKGMAIAKNDGEYGKVIKESMNPKNYKRMVLECQRYKKEFGLSNLAIKYKKIYEQI